MELARDVNADEDEAGLPLTRLPDPGFVALAHAWAAGEELDLASEQPLPDRLMAELEKEQMVRDAIVQLNPRCEQMVRMLFFENPPRPYQEVADGLGLATGSIGFIRGRCLQKLKKHLEKMGF